MSKILYIIDNGHGGIDPNTGKYVTPGKRSPKKDDGTQLYEGVNNRILVKKLLEKLEELNVDAINLVDTYQDVPLYKRINLVKSLNKNTKCIVISIHSNAAEYKYIDKECTIRYDKNKHGIIAKKNLYRKLEWTEAKGIGTYIYTNASRDSKEFAKIVQDNFSCQFKNITRDRGIRARNFAILRETPCPAVLLEIGFHTNKQEVENMETEDWRSRAVTAISDAIIKWEQDA